MAPGIFPCVLLLLQLLSESVGLAFCTRHDTLIPGSLPTRQGGETAAVCLDIGALDEQDKAKGLKDAITSCIQPIGSLIRQVSRIVYDPSIKDAAPCPQLSFGACGGYLVLSFPSHKHFVLALFDY